MLTAQWWSVIAISVFLIHVVANFIAVRPTPAAKRRLDTFRRLSLFPPDWVFSIWLLIWTLQAIMLIQTFGSGIWRWETTAAFVFICIGNLGSQLAGSRNAHWSLYISFLGCMLISSIVFMLQIQTITGMTDVGNWASQLYVGWAILATLIGLGIIVVFELSVVSDKYFTVFGLCLVAGIPLWIWIDWALRVADYRIVSLPFFLLIIALLLRKSTRHNGHQHITA